MNKLKQSLRTVAYGGMLLAWLSLRSGTREIVEAHGIEAAAPLAPGILMLTLGLLAAGLLAAVWLIEDYRQGEREIRESEERIARMDALLDQEAEARGPNRGDQEPCA